MPPPAPPQGTPPPAPADKNGGPVGPGGSNTPRTEWGVDAWVERANQAITWAREQGTPAAWQEASSAAAAVVKMAQTMEVMSRARKLADDMARIAGELADKARAAAQAAAVARETSRQVEVIVDRAQSANSTDAWDKALNSATTTWNAVDASSLVGPADPPAAKAEPA